MNQGRHPRDWDGQLRLPAQLPSLTIHKMLMSRAGWLTCRRQRQDITCATKYLESALEVLSYATPKMRDHLFL